MDGYVFKGIRCPLCDHHFTERIHGNVYEIAEKEYHKVVCPACGIEIYVGESDLLLVEDASEAKMKGLMLE